MPDKSTAEPESDAIRIPAHTASTEELEAYLELKNRRYLAFLRDNPALQDPRVREEIKQEFKECGPEYLRLPSPYIPGAISVQVTDGSAFRMIAFESEIARLSMAIKEKHQSAAKHHSPSVGQGSGNPPPEIAEGAIRAGYPARDEIEKHAQREFAVAGERNAVKHGKKRNEVLIAAAQTGNVGSYVPALTTSESKFVRQQIIALAKAYAKAFKLCGGPCDLEAERSLADGAQQIAGGSIAYIIGQLDLIQKRTGATLNNRKGLHGAIGSAMRSAVNAGRLRLERQRIEAKSTRQENSMPGSQRGFKSPMSQGGTAGASLEARRKEGDATKAAERQSFMAQHIAPTPRKPTMNALAEKIDVAQSSLSRWLSGRHRLSKTSIGKLAERLGVDPGKIPN